MSTVERADAVVVGGGVVGLASAWQVARRRPGARVLVLDKEHELAAHQTGRNSGVIHSGIYYKPGSLKATNCRRGKAMLEAFCQERGIAFETCGKVIVALDEAEAARLNALLERGKANGVDCELIGPERLREIEPHVNGVRAIRVREAGIVDYGEVCKALVEGLRHEGGQLIGGARVVRIERLSGGAGGRWRVLTADGRAIEAGVLINCAGLHSDRVTSLAGEKPPAKIVPFRGEYFTIRPEARRLVNHLIYPVPDPAFPFLGVHFTRMIHQDAHGYEVECGPNAVLAFAREGYFNTTVNLADLMDTLSYPAFWKIAAKHWRTGAGEMYRSFSKAAFVRALQRLIPAIQADDIEPAPAGVRAQALAPDGKLVDDFAIVRAEAAVHVVNAPSPAATSSLSIGDTVAEMACASMPERAMMMVP